MTHEQERAAVAQSLALDHDHGTYARRQRCFLAQFSDRPCDGRLIRAHLIPKNLLGRELAIADRAWQDDENGKPPEPPSQRAVDDPRITVWACGGIMGNAGHHGMLDASRTLRIPRDRLPPALEEFAEEVGLSWWLDREYGERS